MSRRNRNNNRYNNRSRNKWDEGYDDDYFDEEEQESEEEESSDEQDEYDQSEYEEDEQYEEDPDEEEYDDEEYDEEYDEDESEDEQYDEEEYDEEESDDEEYDEDESDEEYDEDESDDEDVEEDEEEDYEDDEEDDELESEIDAAAESTAKKSIGNSDLLSKLRGQMRPQLKEDATASSNNDTEIKISPLSLFGQPLAQNGKNDNAKGVSSAAPQHANAKIVQTAIVPPKQSSPSMAGSMQKSGSGRVITAQSQNGASVTSVQPRDFEAEKAEAERKQKEKERLEKEQRAKEEKSARVLDKFKGKRASAGESAMKSTKDGATWLWSKISSSAVWIWAGIAACFLWVVTSPKRAWQTWKVFDSSWWSGIWSGMKKPFVGESSAIAQTDGSEAVPSGSETAEMPVGRKKSRKKNVDIWDAESAASANSDVAASDAFASKEPDSRRRLYFSLSSIGAAAVVFLLVLPSMMNGSKKNDENAVAVNGQEAVSADEQKSAEGQVVAEGQEKSADGSDSNPVSLESNGGLSIANPDLINTTSNKKTSDTRNSSPNDRNSGMRNSSPSDRNPDMRNSYPNDRNSDMRNSYSSDRNSGMRNQVPDARNPGMRNRDSMPRTGSHQGSYDAPSQYPVTPAGSDGYRSPSGRNNPSAFNGNQPIVPPAITDDLTPPTFDDSNIDLPAPEIPDYDVTAPDVPELDMTAPEIPSPEVTELETPQLDTTVPEITEPEALVPEVTELEAPEPEISTIEPAEIDLSVPDVSTDEIPASNDVETDVSVPEIPEPELVNVNNPTADLETPASPEEENSAAADSADAVSPDVPEDSTVDLTPNLNDLSPSVEESEPGVPSLPDLTSDVEPSGDPVDLPTPEADVPDVPAPDLSDSEPADSNPVETPTVPEPTEPEPTIPEPTIPEPEEPKSIETDVALQPTEPGTKSDPILVPEDNASNEAQIASNPPEQTPSTPEESAVALGTPGPLVSSANTAASSTEQTSLATRTDRVGSQLEAGSSETGSFGGITSSTRPRGSAPQLATSYNSVPSTSGSGYGSGYNGYVYNSSGVYIVQPNDSFWTIARRIYGSGEYARALAQYNSSRVSPQSLTVATQIMTPPPETLEQQFPELCPVRRTASASPTPVDSLPAGTRVYIVDQEESVMEIARRELGSILYCSQVYALNQSQLSGNVDRVKPGVRLLLPVKN